MARLTAAKRKKIPSSEFGLPSQRAYPMPDRKHAAVAKAYAERYATPSERATIDAKANRILHPGKTVAERVRAAASTPHPHANLGKYLHPKKG